MRLPILFFLAAGAASSAGCAAMTTHRAPPMKPSIDEAGSSYHPRVACFVETVDGKPASVRLALVNQSDGDFRFRDGYFLSMDGPAQSGFEVIHDGALEPGAACLSESPCTMRDTDGPGHAPVPMHRGARVTSAEVDIVKLFELKEPGSYWVLYRSNEYAVRDDGGGRGVVRLVCAPATLNMPASTATR